MSVAPKSIGGRWKVTVMAVWRERWFESVSDNGMRVVFGPSPLAHLPLSVLGPVTQGTYLQQYLLQLQAHPLRTKSITSAILSGSQEIIASRLAGLPSQSAKVPVPIERQDFIGQSLRQLLNNRATWMAFYGAFISAPLGHVLVTALQKAFAGKTTASAKIAQILASNIIIAPIQNSVYLISMAIINGARTKDQIARVYQSSFMQIMRISWITSPLAILAAQRFIEPAAWVPFFNLVAWVLGIVFNTLQKRKMLAASRRQSDKEARRQRRGG